MTGAGDAQELPRELSEAEIMIDLTIVERCGGDLKSSTILVFRKVEHCAGSLLGSDSLHLCPISKSLSAKTPSRISS
jgi:hypothetical protein